MTDEPQRRPTLDASTAEILEGLEKKQAEARLPREERERLLRERKKAKARLPRRVNWDLPTGLKSRIVEIAGQHRLPTSQVAAFLLFEGLRQLEAGEIDLEPYKMPSNSPRYDWILDLSEA